MKPFHLVKLLSFSLFASSLFLASCSKENTPVYSPAPGYNGSISLEVHLTNGAHSNLNAINLDIVGLEYNTGEMPDLPSGWQSFDMEQVGNVDIAALKNGNSIRLTHTPLNATSIKMIRLRLGDNNFVDNNGVHSPLTIPEDVKENGIVIAVDISNTNSYAKDLWLDIDANNSINYDSNDDTYTFYPQVRTFDNYMSGSIEGYIEPGARPEIYLQTDINSRSAYLNTSSVADLSDNGYFKFVGLPEGLYQVEFVAKDGSNRDKMITEVQVTNGEVTNLGYQDFQ